MDLTMGLLFLGTYPEIPFWKCWVKALFPKHSPQNVTLLNDYRKTKHIVSH